MESFLEARKAKIPTVVLVGASSRKIWLPERLPDGGTVDAGALFEFTMVLSRVYDLARVIVAGAVAAISMGCWRLRTPSCPVMRASRHPCWCDPSLGG